MLHLLFSFLLCPWEFQEPYHRRTDSAIHGLTMGCGHQDTEGGRREKMSQAEGSGRIQAAEGQEGLRVPAALGHSLARAYRARENISAAASAWAHLHGKTL